MRHIPFQRAFGILIIVLMLGTPAHAKATNDDIYAHIELLSDAITAIQHDYVEKVPAKDIIYGALKGMLGALDPYSQFMDPEIFKELQVETEGEFGGLGIEITLRDDLLTIITPLDGTPAAKAGLKALDRIVRIDGEITRDMTLTEAVKRMRGKPGSDVKLTIMREATEEVKEYVITRAVIQIRAVRKAAVVDKSIGYIKLTDFSEKTKGDLDKALEKLEKDGMTSLILDLRNNPGGLLISSVETVSEFLPTGKLIVSTKGRETGENNVEYRATGKTHYKDIPLIVMINAGSASASEIVAGAIQDHKRGIILGTKSFGKGSVQTVIPMRDGSALRLTTAKYYTPSGRTIHELGVIPDVVIEEEEVVAKKKDDDTNKKDKDIFEKIQEQEKKPENGKDPAAVTETTPPVPAPANDEDLNSITELLKKDNQLRAAVNLMKGISIYQHRE